ncbi:hypothetical protein AA313_de0208825 [Arthrobotrys entomopaga]|nr:hypothetical protein AA313_de0208825 [Arthrobotrys entomopaga]
MLFNSEPLYWNPNISCSLPPVNVAAAATYCPPQHFFLQSPTREIRAVRVEKASNALSFPVEEKTLAARLRSHREEEILELAEGYPLTRGVKRRPPLDLRMQPASFWVPMTPVRSSLPRPRRSRNRSSRRVKSIRPDPLAQPFFGETKPIAGKDLEAEKEREEFNSNRIFEVIDDLCDAWEEREQQKALQKVGNFVEGVKFAAEVAVKLAKVAWPFVGYLVMEALQR